MNQFSSKENQSSKQKPKVNEKFKNNNDDDDDDDIVAMMDRMNK